MADEAVTLVIRQPATGTGTDRYRCRTVRASWHRQNKVRVTDGGLQAAQIVRCRVPVDGLDAETLADLAALRPGDRIAHGTLDTADAAAFAALARSMDGAVVLDVHDNRRGLCPHYYIEGSG